MTRLREPARGGAPASPIERHLTERSGYYVAEAWGVVVGKLVALALGGLCVWVIVLMAQDGGWGWLVAAPFLLVGVALALWVTFVLFNGLVLERLRPDVRYRRLRGDAPRPVGPEPDARRRPRGRTVLLLVLSAPVALLVVHILSAYVERLVGGLWFDWLSWGYQGIAIEPLTAVTSRWPWAVLAVMLVSLGGAVALLVGAARDAARRRRARAAHEPAGADVVDLADPADLAAPVLRSSPRGQADLISRTALYLVLGLPSAFLVGYVVLAYLDQLWQLWSGASDDPWQWDYPEWYGALGAWFFTEGEGNLLRVVVPTLSAILLVAGIVLAMQAVPLLLRRDADAIDLAVTDTGVVTRGGLTIDWDEMVRVLVVQDVRITGWKSRREGPAYPSRTALHPTYVPGHSRTRVALVLHDLPGVAARATRSQRRALYADGGFASGYALADLWAHPTDRVEAILAPLEAGARAARVPVRHLERVTDPSRLRG